MSRFFQQELYEVYQRYYEKENDGQTMDIDEAIAIQDFCAWLDENLVLDFSSIADFAPGLFE